MSKCEKNKGRITIRTVTEQGKTISSLFFFLLLKREREGEREGARRRIFVNLYFFLFGSGKISNRYESSKLFRINYSLIKFLMVSHVSHVRLVKERLKLNGFIS